MLLPIDWLSSRDEFGNARANQDDVVHAYFSGPLNVIVDVLHKVRDAPPVMCKVAVESFVLSPV
jgi:hypothetical protein